MKPIRVPRARSRKKKPDDGFGGFNTRGTRIPRGKSAYDAFRAAIYTMPDEALGWLMLGIYRQPVWPDGLGGFKPESRVAIQRALAAVLGSVEER